MWLLQDTGRLRDDRQTMRNMQPGVCRPTLQNTRKWPEAWRHGDPTGMYRLASKLCTGTWPRNKAHLKEKCSTRSVPEIPGVSNEHDCDSVSIRHLAGSGNLIRSHDIPCGPMPKHASSTYSSHFLWSPSVLHKYHHILGTVVVKARCCKPDGRGFKFRCGGFFKLT
jgi:hypothetical protein